MGLLNDQGAEWEQCLLSPRCRSMDGIAMDGRFPYRVDAWAVTCTILISDQKEGRLPLQSAHCDKSNRSPSP
jgi:hypothetical protein